MPHMFGQSAEAGIMRNTPLPPGEGARRAGEGPSEACCDWLIVPSPPTPLPQGEGTVYLRQLADITAAVQCCVLASAIGEQRVEVADRLPQAFAQLHGRRPAELVARERDVRLALQRVVRRQGLEFELGGRAGQFD